MIPMVTMNSNKENLPSTLEGAISYLGEAISENFEGSFKELSSTSDESSVLYVVIKDLKKLDSESMTLLDMIKKTDEQYKAVLNKICDLSERNKHSKLIAELKAKSGALNKLHKFVSNNISVITKLKITSKCNREDVLSKIDSTIKNSDVSKSIVELISFESTNQYLSLKYMENLKTAIKTGNSLASLVKKMDDATISKLLLKFSEIVDRDKIISGLSLDDKTHLFTLTLTGESFEKINLAKIEAINSVLNPTVEKKQESTSFFSWFS